VQGARRKGIKPDAIRAADLQRRHGYAIDFFRQRQLHLGEAHDAARAYTLPPVVEFSEVANIVLRR